MKQISGSRLLYLVIIVCLVAHLAACATVGRSFPEALVKEIEIGRTTKEDVRALFGEPWRTGLEDGLLTWTYGSYKYRAFAATESSDLLIRFDENGLVLSYSYSTTNTEAGK